jgi:hypothetical protein
MKSGRAALARVLPLRLQKSQRHHLRLLHLRSSPPAGYRVFHQRALTASFFPRDHYRDRLAVSPYCACRRW